MEEFPKVTEKVLCRFYLSNACFKGDICTFLHAEPESTRRKNLTEENVDYSCSDKSQSEVIAEDDKASPSSIGVKDDKISSSSTSVKGDKASPSSTSVDDDRPSSLSSSAKDDRTSSSSSSTEDYKTTSSSSGVKGDTTSSLSSSAEDDKAGSSSSNEVKHTSTELRERRPTTVEYRVLVTPDFPLFVLPQITNTGSTTVSLCSFVRSGYNHVDGGRIFVHDANFGTHGRPDLLSFDERQGEIDNRSCNPLNQTTSETYNIDEQSRDKVCGICMESVWPKKLPFGILQSCKHCYCLSCISKWRHYEANVLGKHSARRCPKCLVHSSFVIPARRWIEDPGEKLILLSRYLENNKKIRCKYIRGGDISDCPFGNKCFYKHEIELLKQS
uniref:RING-type E3 ubiquitin transferase n=1 Tax=Syphacia muris TaxID=451379 RepID=A0A0N5ATD9_9BILA